MSDISEKFKADPPKVKTGRKVTALAARLSAAIGDLKPGEAFTVSLDSTYKDVRYLATRIQVIARKIHGEGSTAVRCADDKQSATCYRLK